MPASKSRAEGKVEEPLDASTRDEQLRHREIEQSSDFDLGMTCQHLEMLIITAPLESLC